MQGNIFSFSLCLSPASISPSVSFSHTLHPLSLSLSPSYLCLSLSFPHQNMTPSLAVYNLKNLGFRPVVPWFADPTQKSQGNSGRVLGRVLKHLLSFFLFRINLEAPVHEHGCKGNAVAVFLALGTSLVSPSCLIYCNARAPVLLTAPNVFFWEFWEQIIIQKCLTAISFANTRKKAFKM